MTAGQLIKLLGEFPADADVHVPMFYGQEDGTVVRVEWYGPVWAPDVKYVVLEAE